jgi:hypothetical protein
MPAAFVNNDIDRFGPRVGYSVLDHDLEMKVQDIYSPNETPIQNPALRRGCEFRRRPVRTDPGIY